jgi:hypothetical protein
MFADIYDTQGEAWFTIAGTVFVAVIVVWIARGFMRSSADRRDKRTSMRSTRPRTIEKENEHG